MDTNHTMDKKQKLQIQTILKHNKNIRLEIQQVQQIATLNPTDVPKDGAIKYENFENDTDKAPNIRIILNRDNLRTVEGTVFEDTRNVDEQNARVGDGLKDNETGINGVRVQLVELRQGKDGKTYEYIWKEVLSGNTDSTTPIINNSGLVPNYRHC